jgi:hypothetical protein
VKSKLERLSKSALDSKEFRVVLALLVSVWGGLYFLQKINLYSADIGRHIRNGLIFLESGQVLSTNFYSYTQPDLPVITHHWLSGVAFSLIWKMSGFAGLTLFSVLCVIVSLGIILFLLRSNLWVAVAGLVAVLPLLGTRYEIRPEVISLVFISLSLVIFFSFLEGKLRLWQTFLFELTLQVVWVNTHIFFVFNFAIIGSYLVAVLVNKLKPKEKLPSELTSKFSGSLGNKLPLQVFCLLLVVVLASLISPFGFEGLLEPFLILREFGYPLAENQTLFFMQQRFGSPEYWHFEILFALCLALGVFVFFKKKLSELDVMALLLMMGFGILGIQMMRFMSIWTIFGVIFVTRVVSYNHFANLLEKYQKWLVAVIGAGIFLGLIFTGSYISPFRRNFGVGLLPKTDASIRFYEAAGLYGPVFNNYDIGGYLIFALPPSEKVFVDNRPEAYTVSFFRDVYIPMQINADVWQEQSKKYDFKTIYFYRHDLTPWGQSFLIARVKDPEWVPVFLDEYAIILVRNTEEFSQVVLKYRIPDDVFSVR